MLHYNTTLYCSEWAKLGIDPSIAFRVCGLKTDGLLTPLR